MISDVTRKVLEEVVKDGYCVCRWIPCEEDLPEQFEDGQPPGVKCSDCVLITDGCLVHMAYYVNDIWNYADCGQVSDFVEYEVKYWMPIPRLPKKEDE